MTSPTLNLYYLPFETEDLFYLNRSPARSVGELREEIYTRQDVLFRRNGITMAELALYAVSRPNYSLITTIDHAYIQA